MNNKTLSLFLFFSFSAASLKPVENSTLVQAVATVALTAAAGTYFYNKHQENSVKNVLWESAYYIKNIEENKLHGYTEKYTGSEDSLLKLALDIKNKEKNSLSAIISDKKNSLGHDIDAGNQLVKKLESKQKEWAYTEPYFNTLCIEKKEVEDSLGKVVSAHNLLKEAESKLLFLEAVKNMSDKYAYMLQNREHAMQNIEKTVHAPYPFEAYPYRAYIKQLHEDINTLYNFSHIPTDWKAYVTTVNSILPCLETIKNNIITSAAYRAEIIRYQDSQLLLNHRTSLERSNQEIAQAEQSKAQAAISYARSQEKIVAQNQELIRLKDQEIRSSSLQSQELKRQNDLLKEQNMRVSQDTSLKKTLETSMQQKEALVRQNQHIAQQKQNLETCVATEIENLENLSQGLKDAGVESSSIYLEKQITELRKCMSK